MLEVNGYQLRNLQEQVEKNKNDIIAIINEQGTLNQFGIKVVGQIDILNNLPTVEDYKESNPNWEYGDAYAVGVTAPYSLYILTRAGGTHPNDYWFNIGQFPLQGAQGKDGTAATVEVAGTVTLVENSPARVENIGDKTNAKLNFYIPRGEKGNTPTIAIGTVESTTGNPEVTNSGTNTGAIFNFKLPKGEKGDKGDTGATGESFRIIATLDNTNQLPTPTEAIRSNAYLIPDEENENHLWVITGDTTLLWTDAGQIQGVKGEQGPQGPAGTPGTNGTNGTAATVSIGSVTTLQPNASATVTNVGTPNNAVLNFGIPKGVDGTGISAVGVEIIPSGATQGTLTEQQLNTLQNNDSNYILHNNEKFDLMDKQYNSGYLTYSHVGQNSTHTFQIKSITITLNTRGWVLYKVTPSTLKIKRQSFNPFDWTLATPLKTLYDALIGLGDGKYLAKVTLPQIYISKLKSGDLTDKVLKISNPICSVNDSYAGGHSIILHYSGACSCDDVGYSSCNINLKFYEDSTLFSISGSAIQAGTGKVYTINSAIKNLSGNYSVISLQ